jgi:hypothetical protein
MYTLLNMDLQNGNHLFLNVDTLPERPSQTYCILSNRADPESPIR